MPYSVPTLRQLIDTGLIDLETSLDEVLPKFGVEQALNVAVSGSVRDLYDYTTFVVRQIIPTSETEDQSIIDTARYEGVIHKLAPYAVGPVSLTGSSSVPVGAKLSHQDGRIYSVTIAEPPLNGTVIVTVQADEVGVAGNLVSGEILTLVSAVPGIQPNGISNGNIGGAEDESIASVLDRLLFRKRNPPMGGAVFDYVAWCREVPGVSRAWGVDFYQGGSTVGYAFVFDDREDILPTYSDYVAMNNYIFRHADPSTGSNVGRPAGIEAIAIQLTLKTTDIDVIISPDTPDNRTAVEQSIRSFTQTLSPGQTMYKNSLGTAIGSTPGIDNYTIGLAADVPAQTEELNTIGAITWGTL